MNSEPFTSFGAVQALLGTENSAYFDNYNQHKIETYNQYIAANGLPFDDEDLCIELKADSR